MQSVLGPHVSLPDFIYKALQAKLHKDYFYEVSGKRQDIVEVVAVFSYVFYIGIVLANDALYGLLKEAFTVFNV